ncbi:MAG TPA: ACP phosphodiesterase [Candidatus Limnocylindria bacterium]|jgi:acyl carrier protein phosphodiesterase|nr:ACP phosphodiesterase [Candidatus Limnocylindria bacterium]
MNWLAHLYLSEATPAFRIGNLLPDLAPASELVGLRREFQRGISQHRHIDAFTDRNPVFRQSIARIEAPYRRYGGILVDVFYDHFLARDWATFSSQPLAEFVAEVYASFDPLRAEIPPLAYHRLEQMKAGDWLNSYGDLKGIAVTLNRMAARFSRPTPIAGAGSVLEENYQSFRADFMSFFPELVVHVATRSK